MKRFASGLRMCGALVAAVMVTLLAVPGVARADGPLTLRKMTRNVAMGRLTVSA